MDNRRDKNYIIKTMILSKTDEFSIEEIECDLLRYKNISDEDGIIEYCLTELVYYGLVYDRGNRFIVKPSNQKWRLAL